MTDSAQVILDIVFADGDDAVRAIEARNIINTGNGLMPDDPKDQPSQTVGMRTRLHARLARTALRPSAAQVIASAAAQVGTREAPAGSNNVAYSRWYGMIGPWCAMFASWAIANAGQRLPITTSKGFAYCPYGVEYFKSQGQWSQTPRVGALVFYQWPGVHQPCHVGIVYKVDADGTIWTIEGNTSSGSAGSQSNGGMVARRHRSTTYVVGYGMPDYGPPAPPKQDRFLYLKNPPMRGMDVKGIRHALRVAGNPNLPEGYIYDQATAVLVNKFNDNHHILYGTSIARGVRPGTWAALRRIVHGH